MLLFFFARPLKMPHNAEPCTETTRRFCFFARSLETVAHTHRRRDAYTEKICVSDFLLHPLNLPHNADDYAETTMRFPLELPHDADTFAETTMRFCFSAKPPGTAP